MKYILRKLHVFVVLLLIVFHICSETSSSYILTLAETNKHYKHFSDMMNELKSMHSIDSSEEKKVKKIPSSFNFIQKNEITSKSNNKNQLKTENKIGISAFTILNTASSNSNKKSDASNKKITYKIVKERNDLLSNKKITSQYKECSIKSGLIYFITDRPRRPSYQIKVLPVVINITTDKLFLTKNELRSNLLQSINLVDIQRIDQHYLGTFCFDLILNQIVDNKFQAGQLSLCGKNEKDMNNWIKYILEFKKCSIKGAKRIDHNGKIILDMEKINQFTMNNTLQLGKNYELEDLFYDAEDTAFHANTAKVDKIKKTLENIVQMNEKGDIATTQLHRQWKGRLMKASMFRKRIKQSIFNMNMAHSKRIFKEKEKEAKLSHKKVAKKELTLLQSAAKKISKFKKQELLQYQSMYEHQINIQKQRSITRSKHFMYMVKQEKKLGNYKQCYSKELKELKNMVLVERMCKQYYGLFGSKICMRRQSFCSMCCDFHIGISYAKRRFECKTKCNKIIKVRKIRRKKGRKGRKGRNRRRNNRPKPKNKIGKN